MKVYEITKVSQLESLQKQTDKPIVIDFHGEDWCVPCKRFAPTFSRVADDLDGVVVFVKIDIDRAEKELMEEFGIMSVPSIRMVAGEHVVSLTVAPRPQFKQEIEKFL